MEIYKIFSILGVSLFIGGGLAMIIQGFRVHFLWGLSMSFLPFFGLAFISFYWHKAKYPLLANVLGLGFYFLAAHLQANPPSFN